MAVGADRKTVRAIIAFAPPAIEDAQVQAAVAAGFLAAGTGGFERAARVVQPYVATGNHLARNVHIVILDEDEVALQLAVFAEMDDMLNEFLSIVIARVRFAGINEL